MFLKAQSGLLFSVVQGGIRTKVFLAWEGRLVLIDSVPVPPLPLIGGG